MNLQYSTYQGKAIAEILEDLANLRITVFRDFPYLYDGSLAYEQTYLQTYVISERSLVFCVYDCNRLVGATTCIPLADEIADVKQPFINANECMDPIFYFGESILLSRYRGLGLGNRFFDERESHARSFGTFQTTCFCAVERSVTHPMRPVDYLPLNAFWKKRGYLPQPHLQSQFEWLDMGESITTYKTMNYWAKEIG